jgi:nickel/cobalt transporter (NicO) family protein
LAVALFLPNLGRADTVASLLGNFTINQYCGLKVTDAALAVHYVVVFGQLPALRELHLADADGNGVTSQEERDAYVGRMAPGFAENLKLRVNGVSVPLHAIHWVSSLPVEQGGFSLRVDVDFAATLPVAPVGGSATLEFENENYAGRLGWHEIVVEPASGIALFDSNAFSTSLTNGLKDALQSLPADGPLDERAVHLSFSDGPMPPHAQPLSRRGNGGMPATTTASPVFAAKTSAGAETAWITLHTRRLVDAISGPTLEPRVLLLALLGALLLGAVHALSPGHGKTIVGAYLIGSRGTPRHAAFLGAIVTITHTLGVFALGFATLYASRFIVPERLFPILSLVSALLILGMGIVLLVQRSRIARGALSSGESSSFGPFQPISPVVAAVGSPRGYVFAPTSTGLDPTLHSHGGGPLHSHLPPGARGEKVTWKSLLALGISGGLVPCPSAMVLLLAAVALNKTAYGMLLVVAFSFGLAITLTVVGLAFLYARNRFSGPGTGSRWTQVLPVLSAVTITALGIALCIGALKTFS